LTGTLFVAPVINAMGPVTDPKHNDLLNTWHDVDHCVSKLFQKDYRERYSDSSGHGAAFSFFFISWSGFNSNPVHRDFGYFSIYDHYKRVFGAQMESYGDQLYWMYNHPHESGIGNVWGLDWLQNTHSFDILNRFIIERDYFPSVVQIPTEKNDTSHWIENWFPFDVGNRNCSGLNLKAWQPGGQITGEVIDWRNAPDDWSEFHPSFESYQEPGSMKRIILRMLDIKTIVYELKEHEIEKAFKRCMNGRSTVLCAYEHDFRDRAETIMERLIEPVARLSRRYPQVDWQFANILCAAKGVLGYEDHVAPRFCGIFYGGALRIRSSKRLFGPMPYVAVKDLQTEEYRHLPVANIGENVWELDRHFLPPSCIVGIAASDPFGNVAVTKYLLERSSLQELPPRK